MFGTVGVTGEFRTVGMVGVFRTVGAIGVLVVSSSTSIAPTLGVSGELWGGFLVSFCTSVSAAPRA